MFLDGLFAGQMKIGDRPTAVRKNLLFPLIRQDVNVGPRSDHLALCERRHLVSSDRSDDPPIDMDY